MFSSKYYERAQRNSVNYSTSVRDKNAFQGKDAYAYLHQRIFLGYDWHRPLLPLSRESETPSIKCHFYINTLHGIRTRTWCKKTTHGEYIQVMIQELDGGRWLGGRACWWPVATTLVERLVGIFF